MTFTRRALITFVTPVLIVLLGSRLMLPHVAEFVAETGAAPERFGVFGLGIFPYVAAFQLVEIVAFLVPSLSRRRHGDPALRAKLDLAVAFVTLGLAGMQAWSFATQLATLSNETRFYVGRADVLITMVTLVGGVCVQVVASKLITRAGLANGVAVLLVANVFQHVSADVGVRLRATPPSPGSGGLLGMFFKSHDAASPLEMAIVFGAIAIVVIAAVIALARATGMRLTPGNVLGGPYRGAHALVLEPSFPVPSSSYGAYAITNALILFPATLANLKVPGFAGLAGLSGGLTFFPLLLVVMVLLAFWLHRPGELSDLADRLGIQSDPNEARRALVHTLLPSYLFFSVVILAGHAAGVDVSEAPLAVAVVLDLYFSVQRARGATTWVPVWEERRATAVPVLRTVLAARGIETEVNGMSLLWLMQLFAPFAPAVLLVKEEDAARATRILASGEFAEEAPVAEAVTVKAPELAPGRRAVYLAGLVALAGVVAFVGARARSGGFDEDAAKDVGPPAQLTLVRIDDTRDPLASIRDEELPDGAGISIYLENAPAGPGQNMQVHFARIVARTGEPKAETRARLNGWLDKVKLAESDEPARFALEEIQDVDDETRKVTFVGYRSFLLTGAPELTNADVEDASVIFDRDRQEPSVTVILTPAGARRFEEVTGQWVQRRLAIVLDGVIESAPVIKSKIGGGRLTITMGRAEPEKALFDAQHLQRSLRGSRGAAGAR